MTLRCSGCELLSRLNYQRLINQFLTNGDNIQVYVSSVYSGSVVIEYSLIAIDPTGSEVVERAVSEVNAAVGNTIDFEGIKYLVVSNERIVIDISESSDISESDDSHSFFSAVFGGSKSDDVESQPESYTVKLNLSKMSIINLWGLIAAFLLFNSALYLCFKQNAAKRADVAFKPSDV